jgi:ribose/xylose/arabinose/galactoside ABC-type transport system permease subunit
MTRWVRALSGPGLGLLALLAVFVLLLAARGQLHLFLSAYNLQVLFHKNSIIGVISLGMLLVIISGGIDLSVGAIAGLSSVVCIQVYRFVYNGPEAALPAETAQWLGWTWQGGENPWLAGPVAVFAGLAAGTACGLVNGLVITRLQVAPFVVTLGMLSIARGLAVWLAGRTRVSFKGPRPEWVDSLSRVSHDTFFFDPGVWSLFALAVLVAVLLHCTVFGRYVYAVGSNEPAARRSGVPVERTKRAVYTLTGLLAGWAGVLLFAHGNGGDPNGGMGLELEVIAAVVIGGASLAGGMGGVSGTLMGVLILGMLENGVTFFNVPLEAKYVLIGSIVIINTALSQWRNRQAQG